ncbi:MAG: fasciclin domain-containing protein [Ferruginibacter sp.]
MKQKNQIRQWVALILLGTLFTVTLTSCKKDDNPAPVVTSNTITDKVVADASLTLLEKAVIKAGLDVTLKGTGPFTVFAPDDAAFAASGISSATIDALTPAQLSTLLLYHTIPAKILAADVPAGPNAKVVTASGDSVFVTKNSSGVFINGIKVTTADIVADNGVIHKIGRVLNPPAGNIVQTAVASGLDSLVKAVTLAGLAGTLSGGTLTVFAPTNQAFTDLLAALSLTDINQIPIATLTAVLTYHVVGGRAFSSDLANGSLGMLAGGNTTINLSNGTGGGPTILGNSNGTTKSNIIATNIVCTNGVVHLIDHVLLP